ncbi:MAG: AAA family ATPase [bacterium]|nr:AAA family ATPase [bacterium]
MRVSSLKIPSTFKRFASLEITGLGPEVKLIVMLGPNGSGKSSVFDALLVWARNAGRPRIRRHSNLYFNSAGGVFGTPEIKVHPSPGINPPGNQLHVRTAHRNTPDVLSSAVQKQKEFEQDARLDRMIDTDAAMVAHYQRLAAGFLPMLANLDGPSASEDLEKIRARLTPVQDSLTRVLPHLRFTGLGDPTSEGSFYFTRDDVRQFRYENLSGGEKAVFDLLLDVHIAVTELDDPLVCLDEPELHLNPAVQASVLTELLRLLPAGSQLWIATHSVGMIRQAFDIAATYPARVAFLDFGRVRGPAPNVALKPANPSRRLLQEALAVALDDLAGLLAPSVLVVCEGSISGRFTAWDARIYRQIFRHLHQRVEFVSGGGKGDLETAAAIAAVIAPGTRLLKLRDRDDLTEEHRNRLLADDTSLRVLQRRSLESYLVDDEVLEALVAARGIRTDNGLSRLKATRDLALQPTGSAKGALGAVFDVSRQVLDDAEGLGENKHQFAVDVLAPLVHPEMAVTKELTEVLALDPSTG